MTEEFKNWFKQQPLPTIGVVTPKGEIGYSEEALEWAFKAGQAAKASAWRPISEAPKDGTHVITLKYGFKPTIGWWAKNQWNNPFMIKEKLDENILIITDDNEPEYSPTHFMPLPTPPAKQEK